MIIIIGIILLVLIILGPSLWIRAVIAKHSQERSDIPGTGGQLVMHLAKRFALSELTVETTEHGDHYDSSSKTVRLSQKNYQGRSLAAITIAAHEFGHALQDAQHYAPFSARIQWAKMSHTVERLGAFALLAAPLATVFGPAGFAVMIGVMIISALTSTLVHLITLPVEWDASFNRALPILMRGQYIQEADQQAARELLMAAAFTYVSASLASLLNVWRWLAVLRR